MSRAAPLGDLVPALAAALGVRPADVVDPVRAVGGVSHETWLFAAPAGTELVLRREPPGGDRPSTLQREAEALRAAQVAGTPVPTLIAHGVDPVLGAFLVTRRVPGEVSPSRVTRSLGDSAEFTAQLGRALGAIHSIDPAQCPSVEPLDTLARLHAALPSLPVPSPAFEFALDQLEERRPPGRAPVVVHGDFRLGNLVVDDSGLAAVIDWEAVHLGDPMEDVGWLCMRAWRFGRAPVVAGVGHLADLAAGYGAELPLDELSWWLALETLRWGLDCLELADLHLSGTNESLELAVLGRRFYETEYDVTRLVADLLAKGALT